MRKLQSVLDEPYEVSLPCIKISQPLGDFFAATIDCKTLVEITYADVRRMSGSRDMDTYLGIQREVSPKRVKELQQYVNTVDACFPTSVILAIPAKCAEYDEARGRLTLRSFLPEDNEGRVTRVEIAKVLDGQHRIEGLREFHGKVFDINVSIFIEMDLEDQAYLFSVVNLAQTKVNKSLVYDLFEYSKARSPQKTCHNIAVALDKAESSPFHHRIKRLGVATEGRFTETLTQATFVEALLPYLTDDATADRDLFLRGKSPPPAGPDQLKKLIFRNLFLSENDIAIADTVFNYFSAVRERWKGAWDQLGKGHMLNKTNGFKAFMRLLRPVYLRIAGANEVPSAAKFAEVLARSSLRNEDFTTDRFKPGTSGETALYAHLRNELNLQ